MSTQWFQVGRMERGETPSAIIPRADGSNASAHNRGRAWDSNAPTTRDMRLRAEGCALVGLVFNVASKSWHCEPLGAVPSSVDLAPWIKFVQGVVTPAKPATPSTPLHVREDTMRLYQQNDTEDGKVFAFDGGAVWIGPNELKDIIDANRRSGITGPGFTEPLPMPAAQITRLSETARTANGSYIVRDLITELARKFATKLDVKID
ncbi:MAG: hypothetical protein ACTIA6_17160 [Pseudoclavibacter sp.]